MNKYTYRTWGGRTVTVVADRVSFEPGHVVFWDSSLLQHRVVRAERNENVNELTEERPAHA